MGAMPLYRGIGHPVKVSFEAFLAVAVALAILRPLSDPTKKGNIYGRRQV